MNESETKKIEKFSPPKMGERGINYLFRVIKLNAWMKRMNEKGGNCDRENCIIFLSRKTDNFNR